MQSTLFASPLIVDNFVYVGDDDGVISIFRLEAEAHQPIARLYMQSQVTTSPIFANGTLYIANRDIRRTYLADPSEKFHYKSCLKNQMQSIEIVRNGLFSFRLHKT